jgi:hypothetical protein
MNVLDPIFWNSVFAMNDLSWFLIALNVMVVVVFLISRYTKLLLIPFFSAIIYGIFVLVKMAIEVLKYR